MGHSIIRCNCGNDIMEGRNDWHCENCGAVCNWLTGYRLVSKKKYEKIRTQKEKNNDR